MQSQPFARQTLDHFVEEMRGEGEFFRRRFLFTERAAHETPLRFGPGKDDLGEHRFVELNQGNPGGQQEVKLFA